MKPKIGFIGVGIMGMHMASHLMDAGYQVVAYDVSEEMLKKIIEKGAKGASSSKDVAAKTDLIISMVPDSPDVERVALGTDGIIESAREGLIYADMSTIAPGMAIKVSEENVITDF